jgi:ABC-2 type transport system ATP-binding protein
VNDIRINISNLTLSYGKDAFIKDLSFEVNGGSIVKVYGSNGAGKTSLLRCIMGIFDGEEKEGSIELEPQQTIKLLDNTPSLIEDLTVSENIKFFTNGTLITRQQQEGILTQVGMQEFRDDLVSILSSGMKKRIEIAILLWAKPNIICLDEPDNFLDDDGIQVIDYLIKKTIQNKGIVVYSSLDDDKDRIGYDLKVDLD